MSFLYLSSDTVAHVTLPCAALISSVPVPKVVYPPSPETLYPIAVAADESVAVVSA